MSSLFDFTEVPDSTFDPLPAGIYNLAVTDAVMKKTKNDDERLNLTFSVLDGQYQGRKIFSGYNMTGDPKSVNIGKGQLKSLLKVAGRPLDAKGPQDFLNIEISASIKIKAGTGGYSDSNSISSFKPKTDSVPESASQVPF